jgi:glycerol-3-phosphate O-acyltransferase
MNKRRRVAERVIDPPTTASGPAAELVLDFAETTAERQVIEAWIDRERRARGARVEVVGARSHELPSRLVNVGDASVLPIRVAWLPRDRDGERRLRLSELVATGNPRHPRPGAQVRILLREPERCRVVAGEPASVIELRRRHREATGGDDHDDFADYVRRQGVLALERAERDLVGSQYKAARLVPEEVISSARFRARLARLAQGLGRTPAEAAAEARGYLDEMAASHSQLAIDFWEEFARWVVRSYTIDVDTPQLEELRRLGARHALAYLPSHRSYLDPMVLRTVLHRHGMPPNHVLGGVNVAFWPMGPIARRSGIVFIRRSYKDKPIYSATLREYISYLVRKRFNLEWYIEGGRTRTGKLRPPRLGILAYLVDAFRENAADGVSDDVYLVPTSIVYEQLPEVGAMAQEELGGAKPRESFRWMIGYLRAQARVSSTVHVRFGEPLSLRHALETASTTDGERPEGANAASNGSGPRRRDLTVEKVAFEVLHRINRATPVTPTALVTLALLGIGDRALTLAEIRTVLAPLLDYVRRRDVPLTGRALLQEDTGLRQVLDTLAREGILASYSGGPEEAWSVSSPRALEAAFYGNSVVHFFVNRAIAELIAARAASEPLADPIGDSFAEALRLRDLLKFEFFFPSRRDFANELRGELELFDPDWESHASAPAAVWERLISSQLHIANRVLGAGGQAYYVVADRLAALARDQPFDERDFLRQCLATARQFRAQQRIWSSEAISREFFANALKLAANQGLLDGSATDLAGRRLAFAGEMRALLHRLRTLRDLALRDLDRVADSVAAG